MSTPSGLPTKAESLYHIPEPGPYDGHLKEYAFTPNNATLHNRWETWEVKAITLARAIKMFRVGCAFPHTYSDGRIAEERRLKGIGSSHQVYLRSKPGGSVGIFADPGGRQRWTEIARIPVEDEAVERTLIEAQAQVGEATPQAGALMKATALTGIQALTRREVDDKSLELQRRMDELEAMKYDLALQVKELQAEMARRMEQVWLIELFLGSEEQVVVLQEGTPAAVDEKIVVRQSVLCMDEEIAVHDWLNDPERIGQFDHADIESFDQWLLSDASALDAICPYKKGIVALRVRRTDKDRPELSGAGIAGAFQRMQLEELDAMTYLLVRNGEQLYRLWVDVRIWPRLVPRAEDLEAQSPWSDGRITSSDERRAEDHRKQVAAGFVAITGMLQRSTLLHPLPRADINAFNPKHVEDYFRIVYDDDGHNLLGDGRRHEHLTWKGYRAWLKKQIAVGQRVLWVGVLRDAYERVSPMQERTGNPHAARPGRGPHVIAQKVEKSYHGYDWNFLYLPRDDVWVPDDDGWMTRQRRQRRIRFGCYNDELIPLDFLSWRVLEHLIRDRGQRQEYGQFFRVAFDYWKMSRDEAALERPFIDLVLQRAGVDLADERERARCERITRWWKLKVKMTRTIGSDDAKALRMVEKAFLRGDDHDNDPEKLLMEAHNG